MPVLLLPSSITRSTRITERFDIVFFFPLFALILRWFFVKTVTFCWQAGPNGAINYDRLSAHARLRYVLVTMQCGRVPR